MQTIIVAKMLTHAMTRAIVMAHPNSCKPLLSKIFPMISVALT